MSRFVYAFNGRTPDFVIRSGVTYRIVSDHLGSPRYVVATGSSPPPSLVASYDAFGSPESSSSGLDFIPMGFAGGLYDPDTGLVRFGYRDYDAETGRWISKDPLRFGGGDSNLYAYVGNDPINFIDPGGDMKLPANPGGLGPDWTLDPTHTPKYGSRYKHPSGDTLDFHKAQPGKPGWRGKDHWHHNHGEKHLKPGTDVPDPPPICEDENSSQEESEPDEDEPTGDDEFDPRDGNDYYLSPMDRWLKDGTIFIPFPMGIPVPAPVPIPVPAPI